MKILTAIHCLGLVGMLAVTQAHASHIYVPDRVGQSERDTYMNKLVNDEIEREEKALGIKHSHIDTYEVYGVTASAGNGSQAFGSGMENVASGDSRWGSTPQVQTSHVSSVYVIRCNTREERRHIKGCV